MDDNNSINKSIDDIIDYFNCLDENYDFEFLMGILKKSNRLNELIRYISNNDITNFKTIYIREYGEKFQITVNYSDEEMEKKSITGIQSLIQKCIFLKA